MAFLFRVTGPVSDMTRAIRFYAEVLDQTGWRVSPGRHYFDCEGVTLACYDPQADGDEAEPREIPEPLYLAVDDLQRVFETVLKAGGRLLPDATVDGEPLGEIRTRSWGEVSFCGLDPFGNPLCFVHRTSIFRG